MVAAAADAVVVITVVVPAAAEEDPVDPECNIQVPKVLEVCDHDGDNPTYKGNILIE